MGSSVLLDTSSDSREPATVSEKIVTGLVRTSTLPLNGTWRFREDPQNAGDAEGWFNPGSVKGRDVMVPLPWQLASDELREYLGTAWYERDFHLAKEYQNRRIAVHFLGVDH